MPTNLAWMLSLAQSAAASPPPTLFDRLGDVWAYISLGASSIVIAEAAPIVGGFAAFEGHLGLARVMAVIALATWLANVGFYFLGRRHGKWIRTRYRKLGRYMLAALRYVRRRPWRASVLVRFAYGARYVLPLACGAARIPLPVYLLGSAASSVLWTIPFTLLGWAFGETAVAMLGQLARVEDLMLVLILVIIAVVAWLLHRQGRIERAVQRRVVGAGVVAESDGDPEEGLGR